MDSHVEGHVSSRVGLSDLHELRQLRDENAKLKKLVADLSLDRHMPQETLPLELHCRPLRLGDIEIDFEGRNVRGRKRQERLSPKEFDLLSYLAAHANRVVTHGELLHKVWGSDTGGEKEYLRVFISRLRKKIERTPEDPKYLLTEHWVGYRLRLPESDRSFRHLRDRRGRRSKQ